MSLLAHLRPAAMSAFGPLLMEKAAISTPAPTASASDYFILARVALESMSHDDLIAIIEETPARAPAKPAQAVALAS